ncbi:MAG: 16S rRNA (uracil(1498)-N(3))-methyltransferase [Burkholderiales bacterium]
MPRFYVNLELAIAQEVTLPLAVVRHINVLRLRVGEEIILFNGDGYSYTAHLITATKRASAAYVHTKLAVADSATVEIKLAICLIANDKIDLALQKAVELGVAEIIPVISERTQRLSPDKVLKRSEHWQNIIISSCEQCGRNVLPKLKQPLSLKQLLHDYQNDELKVILTPHDNSQALPSTTPTSLLVLVGPEGGFTPTEVKLALATGYQPLQLGNRIMRAETAVIAGITVMQTLYGNFINASVSTILN